MSKVILKCVVQRLSNYKLCPIKCALKVNLLFMKVQSSNRSFHLLTQVFCVPIVQFMEKKRLITSALPYVNNIPHLGNLIQVLSADVFARFCRLKGYDTLYICGTDEYGTATETRALEEGITPKELCDRYYKVHKDIYDWFEIAFDKFGRTSTPEQTEIVQHIFTKVYENGYINEKTIEQLYCEHDQRYLADRYVRGECPHCGYDDARGDQCESCGKLLDPVDLISPRCGTCGNKPVMKQTNHLYIDLPAILPKLQEWISKAQVKGNWARNAIQMTQSWIRDGLKERCITRDLKWGIPVPLDGYRDKVFYVWFDAPIGYISITATHTDDWKAWWQNPEEVELFQFIGKDNIPFHTVIFPSSLIGSGEDWTLLHHMSSSEYLNYESGKFSKSKGVGVFGTDAQDTGIPADVWRFYIFYNRPEKSDYTFTWKDFQEKVNSELIGNLGNLANRTLTFLTRFFDSKVIGAPEDSRMWPKVRELEEKATVHLDAAELKDGLRTIFEIADIGNKVFQDAEPWKTRKEDPESTHALLSNLVYLIRDLGIMVQPYMPATSRKLLGLLGIENADWNTIGKLEGITEVQKPEILFKRLEDDHINAMKEKFSGTQKEREEAVKKPAVEEEFRDKVDLRVAKIIDIQRHPEADKLFIEKLDDGTGEERQIVSGLVPYYTEEELLNKNIILVNNLKPAKLRGVKSQGMLLAAEEGDKIEVIFADNAAVGDRVVAKGFEPEEEKTLKKLKIDQFFEIPLKVEANIVKAGNAELEVNGSILKTVNVKSGEVG